jgi:GSH-dependent disulfide-bond oxidoreductase
MITFFFHETPNPLKVALFLEEAGLPYEVAPVDLLKGEQHSPSFLAVNPNGKAPAIVDDGVIVFDSAAILLYLSEKTGQFRGSAKARPAVFSWLMFIASGLSPFSGQASHFGRVHTESAYATNRYRREVERHYSVMNKRLGEMPYIAGDDYTIADMAAWGWVSRAASALLNDTPLDPYPNVKLWFASIDGRPAAERARKIADKIPFKKEFDEETLRALFPQNFSKVA